MPPPRPRGVGTTAGVSSGRPNPNTPMSERQQMALLIQMTSTTGAEISRSNNSKKTDHKKSDEIDEVSSVEKTEIQEIYVDKSVSVDFQGDTKLDILTKRTGQSPDHGNSNFDGSQIIKRNFSDIEEDDEGDYEEGKKRKKKESDGKLTFAPRAPSRSEKSVKQFSATNKNSPTSLKSNASEKDFSCESPKNKSYENDGDTEESKISENYYSGGLKVPPLKIVIPSQNCTIDTDGNVSRNGKATTSRNAALPYVVTTSNDTNDRDNNSQCNSPNDSPMKNSAGCSSTDDKNTKLSNDDKSLQRVLRSSHRSSASNIERTSNNSSPQLQSNSPSPAPSSTIENVDHKISLLSNNIPTSPILQNQVYDNENITNLPSPSTSSTSSSKEVQSNTVDLHPRKRKIRSKPDESSIKLSTNPNIEASSASETHPYDYPFTNCFQMYINIRKQIEKKHKSLCPIKLRPPQGYNDYLIRNRTYVLNKNKNEFFYDVPHTISLKMRDIFLDQEKERYELSLRHTVEKEKLSLNVEQEILRVHTKAARSISCQPVPFSVCSLLKDEEIYNMITPEQEEKDRNARYRFNGRLLLSWLQDVDDKWEKIKDAMVLRHHNEAESLRAVQLMDWEIALKQRELCDYNVQAVIEEKHVPMVHVTDDFDLLPA